RVFALFEPCRDLPERAATAAALVCVPHLPIRPADAVLVLRGSRAHARAHAPILSVAAQRQRSKRSLAAASRLKTNGSVRATRGSPQPVPRARRSGRR